MFLVPIPRPGNAITTGEVVPRRSIGNVFPEKQQLAQDNGDLRGIRLVKVIVEYAAIKKKKRKKEKRLLDRLDMELVKASTYGYPSCRSRMRA